MTIDDWGLGIVWGRDESTKGRRGGGTEIRTRKLEIRNTKQTGMIEEGNPKQLELEARKFRSFEFSSFGVVSNFALRASSFEKAIPNPQSSIVNTRDEAS
ncbi:MAG: hypothetical protein V3W34_09485 [Phycisphaerae bacterium]